MIFDFDTMYVVLLALLLSAAVWTVMTSHLLKSAIGLAVTSVVLTLILFLLKASLAGVFELSVCAGLITVVFISAISLTKPVAEAEAREMKMKRLKRFIFLPILLLIAGWLLRNRMIHLTHPVQAAADAATTVQQALWSGRRFDLVGQILIILAGIFGIIVLFKTKDCVDDKEKKQ